MQANVPATKADVDAEIDSAILTVTGKKATWATREIWNLACSACAGSMDPRSRDRIYRSEAAEKCLDLRHANKRG